MTRHRLRTMTKDEYIECYKRKGWTTAHLANRWGFSKVRVYQIAEEVELGHSKKQAHLDMLNGLPKAPKSIRKPYKEN